MNSNSPERSLRVGDLAGRELKRVLFFGKNMSRSRCTSGLVEALRDHGLRVKWCNMATLRRWLGPDRARGAARRAFRSFRPDIVFVFWRDLPLDLLEEFKREALTVSWVEEALTEFPESEFRYLRTPDVCAMSNVVRVREMHLRGARNAMFQMAGFSPTYHHEIDGMPPVRDAVFVGGPGGRGQRGEFLAGLSRTCAVEVFGRGWNHYRNRFPGLKIRGPVRPRGFRRVMASSRVVLGLNEVNDVPFHFSNRTFLVLACGAFHLTRYVPGLEDVFQDGVHLAWFKDDQECQDKLRYYLEHADLRHRVAVAGRELVTQRHRYYHRVGDILKVLRHGHDADTATPDYLLRMRDLLRAAGLPDPELD